MTKFILNLLVILFILLNNSLFAQKDTEFWFAAPEVSKNTLNNDRPIFLIINTYEDSAAISISQPAMSNFLTILLNLPPYSSYKLDLTQFIDQLESKPGNIVLNYGLHILSDNEISVHYEVNSLSCNCNSEIFVLRGKEALGTNFVIPGQNYFKNSDEIIPKPYNSFDIVATENNTLVTIYVVSDVVGWSAGQTYTVLLNKGQTYSAVAVSNNANEHLNGSIITSSMPIAITVKDDFLSSMPHAGGTDLTGDQIVPVERLGTKYIVVKGLLNSNLERVFLISSSNNNDVFVNGVFVKNLNGGETYMHVFGSDSVLYIETSEPTYVYQLTGFRGEMSASLVPQIECSGVNSSVFQRTNSEELVLMLIVKASGVSNFLVNNNSTFISANDFKSVPGTNNLWKYAKVNLSLNDFALGSIIKIENSTNIFHIAKLNGEEFKFSSFGFLSGFNKYKTELALSSNLFCEGDIATLSSEYLFGTTYNWHGPNGFNSTGQNVNVQSFDSTKTGWYFLQAVNQYCEIPLDSIFVNYIDSPEANFTFKGLCLGNLTDFVNLSVEGDNDNIVVFNWDFGNGMTSNLLHPQVLFQQKGEYLVTLEVISSVGCKDSVQKTVKIVESPKSYFEQENVCLSKEMHFYNYSSSSEDNSITYFWDFGNNQTSNLRSPKVSYNSSGNYNVSLSVINENGCISVYSNQVSVYENPIANILTDPDFTYVSNPMFTFNSNTNAQNWIWDMGDGNQISVFPPFTYFYPSTEADYVVKLFVTNEFGCVDTIEKNISVYDFEFNIPNIITPNGDGFNDYFIIENIDRFPNNYIEIFNRWGTSVFKTSNYTNNWDGGNLADGTYFYVLRIAHKEFQGSITILRKY